MDVQETFSVKAFFQSPETGSFYVQKFPFDIKESGNSPELFAQLLTRVSKAFSGHLECLDDLIITWRDCDGDYVTMSSSSELQDALNEAESHTLKIYITANPKVAPAESPEMGYSAIEFYPSTDNQEDKEPQIEFSSQPGLLEEPQENLLYPTESNQYTVDDEDNEEEDEEQVEAREVIEEIKAAVPVELRIWAKNYIKHWFHDSGGDLSVLLDGIDTSDSDDEDIQNKDQYTQENNAMKSFRKWLNKFLLQWHTGFMVKSNKEDLYVMDEDETTDEIPDAFKIWAYTYMERRENVIAEFNKHQRELAYFDDHGGDYFVEEVPTLLSYPMDPLLPATNKTTSSATQPCEKPTPITACKIPSSVSMATISLNTSSSTNMAPPSTACTAVTIMTTSSNTTSMNYPTTPAGLTSDKNSVNVAAHHRLVYPSESASVVSAAASHSSVAATTVISYLVPTTTSRGLVANAASATLSTPPTTPHLPSPSNTTASYTLTYPAAPISASPSICSTSMTATAPILRYPAVSTSVSSPPLAMTSSTTSPPRMVYPHTTTSPSLVQVATTSAPFKTTSSQAILTSTSSPVIVTTGHGRTNPSITLVSASLPVPSGIAHRPITAMYSSWTTASLPMSTGASVVPRSSTIASAPLLLTTSASGLRMSTASIPVTTSPAIVTPGSTGMKSNSYPLTTRVVD